jgi:Fic family protein
MYKKNSKVNIGKYIKQIEGYKAFVPEKFPPKNLSFQGERLIQLLSTSSLLLGKLDGLTKLVPDIDFFIFMYIKKEATLSSQIEGTKAQLTDALHAEIERAPELPPDVDDILHYIEAMNIGLNELKNIPLSLRLIKKIHKVLLTEARSTFFPYPGEFRKTQNWIMGTNPNNARFVPPPPDYVTLAMTDLENFFYSYRNIPILIKIGLIHAQFETIHPFIDGNGRIGRLLITLYLCQEKLLERPVLYLSEYLKKNRDLYFAKLDEYRKGNVFLWLEFFLEGVGKVAEEAIETSNKIIELREKDLQKIMKLGKGTKNAIKLLKNLYKLPIINVKKVEEFTGLSREGANRLVKKFVELDLLVPKEKEKKYGRIFIYKEYLGLFENS